MSAVPRMLVAISLFVGLSAPERRAAAISPVPFVLPPRTAAPVDREPEPARLREILHDTDSPRSQSQAALLLLRSRRVSSEQIIRRGLRQTDSVEVFLALAAGIRLCRDGRFHEELLDAMCSSQSVVRQAAADTLAVVADGPLLLRLQALVEDTGAEMSTRQAALQLLGRTGRKSAAIILLDQLSNQDETIRRTALDALAELSGLPDEDDVGVWREWWDRRKHLSNDGWLEERLAFQSSRSRRLESDLEKARIQVFRLHQQLHERLPAADRLGHTQLLATHDDATLRSLSVSWCLELLPGADPLSLQILTDTLLRLTRDGSNEVQRAAVLALGRVQDQRAFERLRLLLRRGQPATRAAAARALTQQALGAGPEARARQRQVIPALQKALDDPALEVVIEVAENLGTLGVSEAAPVLTVLLHHPSEPVRLAAAQALEQAADVSVLDGMLEALDDPSVAVRFSLVGAIGRTVREYQPIPVGQTDPPGQPNQPDQAATDARRARTSSRLESILSRDNDPGVRSRAATVLGECGSPAVLPALWARVRAAEDGRVQEKAWAALVDIIVRSASLELIKTWERELSAAGQGARRLQLLSQVQARWVKSEDARGLAAAVTELLIPAQLEQGRWNAAWPLVRELIARPGSDDEIDQRLNWLLGIGEQALKDESRSDALRVVQEAQPLLSRRTGLAPAFERLEKQAKR